VGRYASDPVGTPSFSTGGTFFDVRASDGNSFTSVTIADCDLGGATSIQWWDPTGGTSGTGAWQAASDQSYSAGPPACDTVTVNSTTSPTIAQMLGTVFVGEAPALAPTKVSLLAVPPGPVLVGWPVLYAAAVSKGSVRGTLSGTVAFSETLNGSTSTIAGCGAVHLVLGVALCLTAFASGGSYSVTASYSGSGTFASSSSAPLGKLVYQRPAITSADHLTETLKTSFSFPVTASGYPAPTFSEAGALPKGVSLSSSGTLLGSPAWAGTYAISIFATNAAGTAHQRFTLVIEP